MGFDQIGIKVNLDRFGPQLHVNRFTHVLIRYGVQGAAYLDMAIESDLGLMPGDDFKLPGRKRPEGFFFCQAKEI